MTDKLKYIVIVLFFLLCIYSHDEKIERYYTTISTEDDMILLNSSIFLDDGVSETAVKRVESEIQKLPTKLWKQYLLNDGKIRIVADDIVSNDERFVGSFSILDDMTMEIVVNEKYIEYSLCHEFAHYLFYIDGVSEKESYYLLLQEKEELWRDLLRSEKYFYTESEYFAEVGKNYFKGLINEEKYPNTVKFLDTIIEEYS